MTTAALITVVDDDQGVRRSLERLLRAAGYDVALYAGGPQFLDSLDRERPACVLLDEQMPGMRGTEVLAILATRSPDVPAIVVTGHDSPEFRTAAGAQGAAGFFCKPFDPTALLAAIAAAIARGSNSRR